MISNTRIRGSRVPVLVSVILQAENCTDFSKEYCCFFRPKSGSQVGHFFHASASLWRPKMALFLVLELFFWTFRFQRRLQMDPKLAANFWSKFQHHQIANAAATFFWTKKWQPSWTPFFRASASRWWPKTALFLVLELFLRTFRFQKRLQMGPKLAANFWSEISKSASIHMRRLSLHMLAIFIFTAICSWYRMLGVRAPVLVSVIRQAENHLYFCQAYYGQVREKRGSRKSIVRGIMSSHNGRNYPAL